MNILVGLFGIVGNLLVCIVVVFNVCFCWSLNYFFFSLVIVDLIVIMGCEFFFVVVFIKIIFFNDCVMNLDDIYKILFRLLCSVLVVYMVVISVDCFLVVVFFFWYEIIMGKYGLKVMLICFWGFLILFLIFSVVVLFFFLRGFFVIGIFGFSYFIVIMFYLLIVVYFCRIKKKWN